METVKAYYDGSVFVPLMPVNARVNQGAVITFVDEIVPKRVAGKSHMKFFKSLSEEDYGELAEILKDTEKVDLNEW